MNRNLFFLSSPSMEDVTICLPLQAFLVMLSRWRTRQEFSHPNVAVSYHKSDVLEGRERKIRCSGGQISCQVLFIVCPRTQNKQLTDIWKRTLNMQYL